LLCLDRAVIPHQPKVFDPDPVLWR